jgi:pimeloyl-ACP methyl ester carboxylesterase
VSKLRIANLKIFLRKAGKLIAALTATTLASSCASVPTIQAERPAELYVDCRGQRTAAPTVILESGAFGASADWDRVLDDLAKGGRACAYDRSGLGRSSLRAAGKDVISIAQELAQLLDFMGETQPVILVGHSNGALYAETFAALWPGRVAGVVYVNGVGSDDLDRPPLLDDLVRERRLSDLAGGAGQIGLAPIVAALLTQQMQLPIDAAARKRRSLDSRAALNAARDEDRQIIPGLTIARRLGGSPTFIPTAVIFGSADPLSSLAIEWRAAETAPARRARTAWILEAPGATHTSPLVRDRAYVVAAAAWLRSLAVKEPPKVMSAHDP